MFRNIKDINTPEAYDEIYFGKRSDELPAFDHVVEKLKSLNKGGRVLDIGCGLGRYFKSFDGCEIHGTEISTKAISNTQELFPKSKIVQWFAGSPLPYEDGFFDLIWCGEVLEHVQDPKQVVRECQRVLKDGGNALFTTPYGTYAKCDEHLWFFYEDDISKVFDGTKFSVEKYPPKKRTPQHFHITMTK